MLLKIADRVKTQSLAFKFLMAACDVGKMAFEGMLKKLHESTAESGFLGSRGRVKFIRKDDGMTNIYKLTIVNYQAS